jgi:hypothetical protein
MFGNFFLPQPIPGLEGSVAKRLPQYVEDCISETCAVRAIDWENTRQP